MDTRLVPPPTVNSSVKGVEKPVEGLFAGLKVDSQETTGVPRKPEQQSVGVVVAGEVKVQPGKVEKGEVELMKLTDVEKVAILNWKSVGEIFNKPGKRKSAYVVLQRLVNLCVGSFNFYYAPFRKESVEQLESTDELKGQVDKLFEVNKGASELLQEVKAQGYSKEILLGAAKKVTMYSEMTDRIIEVVACLYLSKDKGVLMQTLQAKSADELHQSEYVLKCCVLQMRAETMRQMTHFAGIQQRHNDPNDDLNLLPSALAQMTRVIQVAPALLGTLNSANDNFSRDHVFTAKNLMVQFLQALGIGQ